MEIGKMLYVTTRSQWRAWLRKNGRKEKEIWLVYYNKASGKKRIPYNDAVDEALCYGWIDSIVKKIDNDSFVQRWTPRRKGSELSDLNKERMRRMIKAGKMTKTGLDAVSHVIKDARKIHDKFVIPKDIEKAIKDAGAWKNFSEFPESYRRIRIGWIESARSRPEMFRQRLRYFLKMTLKNKRFGMVQ